ncbi:hypothetical protein HK44_023200 [Pseudomonas fluorescens HK44]|uniref:Uncharacterized protein n=1 Tax=Pseudomonas fluorescens HK44 TaxID=1042209 RepID=A0A010T0B9_PSEFL|nr:hypothetical protein HK44_023200 [Pseudomonas fluorescens HK44]
MSFSKNRARILPDLRRQKAGIFKSNSLRHNNCYELVPTSRQSFHRLLAKG